MQGRTGSSHGAGGNTGNKVPRPIFGLDGKMLNKPEVAAPGVVVIQYPPGYPINQRILMDIANAFRSNVLAVPIGLSIVPGAIGVRQMEQIHLAIHRILGIDDSVTGLEEQQEDSNDRIDSAATEAKELSG